MMQFTRPTLFNSVIGRRILRFGKIGCALLLASVAVSIFFPVFASSRAAARMATNRENFKDLSVAMILYGEKNGDHFPPAESWMNAIEPFVKNSESFQSPFRNDGEYGYAMNSDLSRVTFGSIPNPSGTIMIYETKRSGRNIFASGVAIADDTNSPSCLIAFTDGEVRFLNRMRIVKAGSHPEDFQW